MRSWYAKPQSSSSHRLNAVNRSVTASGSCVSSVLVDHAERREQPDLVEAVDVEGGDAGVAVAVLGTDAVAGLEQLERVVVVRVAPEVVGEDAGLGHRVERRVDDGAADLAADHVVLASVDLGPLDDPGAEGRVEVPGEGVERLVVVVVGVERPVVQGRTHRLVILERVLIPAPAGAPPIGAGRVECLGCPGCPKADSPAGGAASPTRRSTAPGSGSPSTGRSPPVPGERSGSGRSAPAASSPTRPGPSTARPTSTSAPRR